MEFFRALQEQTPQLSLSDPVPAKNLAGGASVNGVRSSGNTTVPRKKFAQPPVKNACLSCRRSRIRCDGQQPCINCTEKHKDCRYEKSRRGGPRVPSSKKRQENKSTSSEDEVKQEYFNTPLVLSNIEDQYSHATVFKDAGAGLRFLDDHQLEDSYNTTEIFDDWNVDVLANYEFKEMPAIYDPAFDHSWNGIQDYSLGAADESMTPEVRRYQDEVDILDAYYVWIHAYFSVLPPPFRTPTDRPIQNGFHAKYVKPKTPITLAISAILALIPLPDDPNARSIQSTLERRALAQAYAKAAFEALDDEAELEDSANNPKDALSNNPDVSGRVNRRQFHPNVPVDLEGNITLMLLAVYEYTQRGNIKKMMNRGGQSLTQALAAKLYQPKAGNDPYPEARRRVWWATYINVCQGSIASNTPCAIDIYDKKFTIEFPHIAEDPDSFPFFIRCQQAIVEATQYVLDHTEILQKGGDLGQMRQRTIDMENKLANLSYTSDAWFATSREPIDNPVGKGEMVVGQALRAIARMKINSARIKIHRFAAFEDKPVFDKRHCDLEPHPKPELASPPPPSNGRNAPSSNGSPPGFSSESQLSGSTANSTPPSGSTWSSVSSKTTPQYPDSHIQPMCSLDNFPKPASRPPQQSSSRLPFSHAYSSKICHDSALIIAETFAVLPYPNPTGVIRSRNPVYNPSDPLNPRNLTATNYLNPYGLPELGGMDALTGGVGLGPNGTLSFDAIARVQSESSQWPSRTMPTFACCAMQSAYALLMLLFQVNTERLAVQEAGGFAGTDLATRKLVEGLREGLGGVVAALENWAGAFEAIDGMREEVYNALHYKVVNYDNVLQYAC